MQCTRIKRVWILGFFVTFLFYVVCAKCITVVEWYLFIFFLVQVVSVVEYFFSSRVMLRFDFLYQKRFGKKFVTFIPMHTKVTYFFCIANSYLMSNLCFIFPAFIYLFAVGFFWGFRIINLSVAVCWRFRFFLLKFQRELYC